MEWSIRKGVDGVITDDPELFLEVCGRHGGEAGAKGGGSDKARVLARRPPSRVRRIKQFALVVFVQILATLFTGYLFFRSAQMARQRGRRRS